MHQKSKWGAGMCQTSNEGSENLQPRLGVYQKPGGVAFLFLFANHRPISLQSSHSCALLAAFPIPSGDRGRVAGRIRPVWHTPSRARHAWCVTLVAERRRGIGSQPNYGPERQGLPIIVKHRDRCCHELHKSRIWVDRSAL